MMGYMETDINNQYILMSRVVSCGPSLGKSCFLIIEAGGLPVLSAGAFDAMKSAFLLEIFNRPGGVCELLNTITELQWEKLKN